MAAVFGAQFGARFNARFGANNLWGPVYPASGAEFAALTGITLDSLYTFQEASGNLLDKAGAVNLTVNGTPTFAYQLGGRTGIHYDASNDRHASTAVHDAASTSFIAFAVFANPSASLGSIVGAYRSDTAADGWLTYHDTGGVVKFDVRDTGSNSVIATTGAVSATSKLHLMSVQIDRTATTARIRVTPQGGTAVTASASIAGFGSLSGGANHLFGFGSMPFLNTSAVFYGGIKIHASTEGASTLQNLHRALGWE